MRRLIWKELRERRWWALAWVLTMLPFLLSRSSLGVLSHVDIEWTGWPMIIPLAAALLVGVGSFGSELVGDRATFVYSRPIRWSSILLAKLLFGAIILVGTLLLAWAIDFLAAHPVYRPFLTLPYVLRDAWPVLAGMAALYLVGLACSVVVPGMAGSLLALAAAALIPFGLVWLGFGILWLVAYAVLMQMEDVGPLFALASVTAFLSALCACIVVARFGIALGVHARVKRYALTYSYIAIPLIVLSFVGIILYLNRPVHACIVFHRIVTDVTVSPTAKYALVTSEYFSENSSKSTDGRDGRVKIVRLPDGKSVMTLPEIKQSGPWIWLTDTLVYCEESDGKRIMPNSTMHLMNLNTQRMTKISHTLSRSVSPDTPYLVLALKVHGVNLARMDYLLVVIDLRNEKTLISIPIEHMLSGCWWEGPRTIGYRQIGRDQKTHYAHF